MVKTIDPRWRLPILIFGLGSIVPLIGVLGADWTIPKHGKPTRIPNVPVATFELSGAAGDAPEEPTAAAPPRRLVRIEPTVGATQHEPMSPPPMLPPPMPMQAPTMPMQAPHMVPVSEPERLLIPSAAQPVEDVRSVVGTVAERVGEAQPDAGAEQDAGEAPPAAGDGSSADAS